MDTSKNQVTNFFTKEKNIFVLKFKKCKNYLKRLRSLGWIHLSRYIWNFFSWNCTIFFSMGVSFLFLLRSPFCKFAIIFHKPNRAKLTQPFFINLANHLLNSSATYFMFFLLFPFWNRWNFSFFTPDFNLILKYCWTFFVWLIYLFHFLNNWENTLIFKTSFIFFELNNLVIVGISTIFNHRLEYV